MNMKHLILTSVLFVAGSSVAVFAAPSFDMAEGLLASPVAQAPAQDPVIQKAIEWIHSKQIKENQMQKNTNPANTIGEKPTTRRLILGGPEIIPM
jgi:hypothetical protein